jgi:hypothetical protein
MHEMTEKTGEKSLGRQALTHAAFTGMATVGPLLFFAGVGYWLDGRYDASPRYMFIGIAVAFVLTMTTLIWRSVVAVRSFSAEADRLAPPPPAAIVGDKDKS